jgi:hypothetical protein
MNGPHFLRLACLVIAGSPALQAQDIFDTPTRPAPAASSSYSDAASFFAATRSGEIPGALLEGSDLSPATAKRIGNSVKSVLSADYGVPADRMRAGTGIDVMLAYAMRHLTIFETTGDEAGPTKERAKSNFQKQLDEVFGREGDRQNETFGDSRAAFTKFARDYSKALQEHLVAAEKSRQDQRLADDERRRREQAEERKVQEQMRLQQEAVDAKIASEAEAERIRLDAEREITELQAAEKQRKLEEVLASREYQLWSQSLRVQQARQMIQEAQQIMNHESAVSAESGVKDLAQLRTAGERMVAGKALLQQAFAAYRQLGGTAATSAEVEVGPDPAAPYR